ncbi:MAG: helix-turn-helix transcriptional regulator [Coriobacteriia bacterium]|nr:helix-turn-helix transcriptional regulator [Coriobacteriia bacterium]MBS5477141.1 helix-turn-helix transcriptional regulator [Coriobacteriia bacterium]
MSQSQSSLLAAARSYLPRPLVPYVGYALLVAWQSILFSSPIVNRGVSMIRTHLFAMAAVALTALVVALLAKRLAPATRHRSFAFGSAVLGAIGTLVIWLTEPLGLGAGGSVTGYVLSSVGLAWLLLCWQECLASRGVRSAVLTLALASVAGLAAFAALMLVPNAVAAGIGVALPLGSAALLILLGVPAHLSQDAPDASTASQEPPANTRGLPGWLGGIPLNLMAIVLLASLVGGAMRTTGTLRLLDFTVAAEWVGFCLSSALATVIACAVAFVSHRRSILTAFFFALPLMFVGCIALVSPVAAPAMAGQGVVAIGSSVIRILVWSLVAGEALTRHRPVLGIFAISLAAEYLGYLLGQGMGSSGAVDTQACVYVALFAILVIALVLVGMQGKLLVSRDALEGPRANVFETRVEALAQRAKLSARETQVLAIWASGHSGAYVEETLGISKNTVKTHLSHIYAKTKTTNREELVSLLETMDEGGSPAAQ